MKKINFLGDSITQGGGASSHENRYSTLAAKYFNAKECNYGAGGTRIAKQKTNNYPDYDNNEFMRRAVLMEKDVDFTVVFGGTNDYGHGDAQLGCMEDRDAYTFYGAMHELVTYLLGKYPKEKLCFILPLPRYNQDSLYGEGQKPVAMYALSKYIEAEKEVLSYYGVEYLDLSDRFYEPQAPICDALFRDGLHPNDAGHKLLADCLIEYLKEKIS